MKIHSWIMVIPVLLALVCVTVTGQMTARKERVDVFLSLVRPNDIKCEKLNLGIPFKTVVPDYPVEAITKRTAGAVRAEVLVGKNGEPLRLIKATGKDSLIEIAEQAAMSTRFSSSKCDDKAIEVTAVIVFNFIPAALTTAYTNPAKAKGYFDVKAGSRFYEPILSLTENYGLTFGYADGGYHPEAPLTKGDFAHFLRKTLDLLQQRAEVSKKIPRDIDLYYAMNPGGLSSSEAIADLDPEQPYARSVGFLITKYDIALTSKGNKFEGELPLSLNQVLGFWERIFGADALPVNFKAIKSRERIMTRGEFALFLQESLFVLTYKVLP